MSGNLDEKLQMISAYVDGKRDEIVQFLLEFISINSVTYNEGEAIRFLASKMREFGFDEVRVDPAGNCVGRVGHGRCVLLYDAHADTVEIGDPADWGMDDPLKAEIVDDVIRGRGAVDDKGCLTGITFAGRAIKELGLEGDFTLWVSGSISEEDVEGSCVKAMMEENPDIKPDYVLVAESSTNRLMRGHKGRALIRITVPGKAAHASAAWRGDNALIKAIPIMQRIDAFNDFVEDPFLGRGTIEVTKIDCKTPSLNTIPGEAVITCDRRISCGETAEELLAEVGAFFEDIPGVKAEIDEETVTTYTGYKITTPISKPVRPASRASSATVPRSPSGTSAPMPRSSADARASPPWATVPATRRSATARRTRCPSASFSMPSSSTRRSRSSSSNYNLFKRSASRIRPR